jgi:hypothetical protein
MSLFHLSIDLFGCALVEVESMHELMILRCSFAAVLGASVRWVTFWRSMAFAEFGRYGMIGNELGR